MGLDSKKQPKLGYELWLLLFGGGGGGGGSYGICYLHEEYYFTYR